MTTELGSDDRPTTIALSAEGPRRTDLVDWATVHRDALSGMRLFAPAGIGEMISQRAGLVSTPIRYGTVGPLASAGLAAAGQIDAVVAFTDPIELRAGDTATRSLIRLAIFWNLPLAGNRATADLLLAGADKPSRTRASDPLDIAEVEARSGPMRLWTVRATVDDAPGRLATLAASFARLAVNILSVQVHLTPDGPVDELLVAAAETLDAGDLVCAALDGGARSPRVSLADAHALVDAPTRALALATRLVWSPDDLADVLTSLLPEARLDWRADPPVGHDDDPTRLWLADPRGGGYLLSRADIPFTPAESARAYAMIDVATMARAVRSDAIPASRAPVASPPSHPVPFVQ